MVPNGNAQLVPCRKDLLVSFSNVQLVPYSNVQLVSYNSVQLVPYSNVQLVHWSNVQLDLINIVQIVSEQLCLARVGFILNSNGDVLTSTSFSFSTFLSK